MSARQADWKRDQNLDIQLPSLPNRIRQKTQNNFHKTFRAGDHRTPMGGGKYLPSEKRVDE